MLAAQPMKCDPGTCFSHAHTNLVILGRVMSMMAYLPAQKTSIAVTATPGPASPDGNNSEQLFRRIAQRLRVRVRPVNDAPRQRLHGSSRPRPAAAPDGCSGDCRSS